MISIQSLPLAEATALLQGRQIAPGASAGFSLNDLSVWRWQGITPPPGHAALTLDAVWDSVIRGWWGRHATWGLAVESEAGKVRWNLILPEQMGAPAINALLPGSRIQHVGPLQRVTARLSQLPCQSIMAGHPATGVAARLDALVEACLGEPFILLIVAQPLDSQTLAAMLHQHESDERFVREEYLARPGLENDNHPAASQCLELILAGKTRTQTALREGGWRTRVLLATADQRAHSKGQALLHAAYAADDAGRPEPLRWQAVTDPRSLTFLRSSELAALTRPPKRELPGFTLSSQLRDTETAPGEITSGVFSVSPPEVTRSRSLALGCIVTDHGESAHWLDIDPNDLCRHLLIAGMTGSGKSVACEHLLLSLWLEQRIPWLVIEPGMKAGYRRLLHSELKSDLRVWTVGMQGAPRLPLNPLQMPPGANVAEHSAALFAVLASAFELVPPMPEVLATAIEQTYHRHGWHLHHPAPAQPAPGLAELIDEVDRVIHHAEYGQEIAGNIRAGLLLRLRRLLNGPLAPELNAQGTLDIASLTARPAIIELCSLPDAASQALVMGLLSLQFRHHWRLLGPANELRHVTVLEEAHRLLRQVPETAANAARVRAVEDLSHMLAELRGFGAGLIIVDQTPSDLARSALANTGSKLGMCLGDPKDRDVVGRALGLPPGQVDLLGSLSQGHAVFHSDRAPRPFRLRMPNPAIAYGHLPPPDIRQNQQPIEENPRPIAACSICGFPSCPAALEGSQVAQLKPRLTDLRRVLAEGTTVTWNWAALELRRTGLNAQASLHPLCFLISLATAARLPESLIRQIRRAFDPETM
jgi:hypothetical protein